MLSKNKAPPQAGRTFLTSLIFLLAIGGGAALSTPLVGGMPLGSMAVKGVPPAVAVVGAAAESAAAAKEARRAASRLMRSRETCDGCKRPPAVCVCAALPARPIAIKTRVLVLQHPNEFKKKICSTVPLLKLCLEHVTVKVGHSFDERDLPQPQGKRRKPLLLFPSPEAQSLDGEGEGLLLEDDEELVIVLIDGTWTEAKRIARESPGLLAATTHVKFALSTESDLNILRKEPQAHCISTLEACARALSLIEPTDDVATASTHLTASLKAMVRHQMSRLEKSKNPRFVRR